MKVHHTKKSPSYVLKEALLLSWVPLKGCLEKIFIASVASGLLIVKLNLDLDFVTVSIVNLIVLCC